MANNKTTATQRRKLRRAAIKASVTPNWGDDGDDNFTEECTPDVLLTLLNELEEKDAVLKKYRKEIEALKKQIK